MGKDAGPLRFVPETENRLKANRDRSVYVPLPILLAHLTESINPTEPSNQDQVRQEEP